MLLYCPSSTGENAVRQAVTDLAPQIELTTAADISELMGRSQSGGERVILLDVGACASIAELKARVDQVGHNDPVILLTEIPDSGLEKSVGEIGAVDVLAYSELTPGMLKRVLKHVAARRQAERQLQRLALFDASSGLASQVLFWEILSLAVHRSRRNKDFFSLMLLDIDWSQIPPDLAPNAIPVLFKHYAGLVKHLMRASDTVARFDRAQIVVLAESMPRIEDVQIVSERIISECQKPVAFDGQQLKATIGIGIALFPTSATSPEALISRASQALSSVRERGGNSFAFA